MFYRAELNTNMKKKPTLPKELTVIIENEGTEDQYLNATPLPSDACEMGVKKLAGVYVLKEIITLEGVVKKVSGDKR